MTPTLSFRWVKISTFLQNTPGSPKVQFPELRRRRRVTRRLWGISHFAPRRALCGGALVSPSWPLSRLTSLWSVSQAARLNLERGQRDWRGRGNTNLKTSRAHKKTPNRIYTLGLERLRCRLPRSRMMHMKPHDVTWQRLFSALIIHFAGLRRIKFCISKIPWEVLRWIGYLCQVIKAAPKWAMDQVESVGFYFALQVIA